MTLAPCPRCGGKTYIDKEDRRITCWSCAATIAYIEADGVVPFPIAADSLLPRSAKHGTSSGYARGCRCDLCKEYKSAHRADAFRHGTVNAYNYHGCRCRDCSAVMSARKRKRPSRAKTG